MYMCLARGGGCEWLRGLGLGFTNPVVTRGMCVCLGCGGMGGVGGGWCRWGVGRWLGPGSRGAWWCYVCVSCESAFFM